MTRSKAARSGGFVTRGGYYAVDPDAPENPKNKGLQGSCSWGLFMFGDKSVRDARTDGGLSATETY